MVNVGPLAAEICWRVWGTPANFNGFRLLAVLLHGILHCVSKKFPPFNCLLLCQVLIDFQIFCSAGKRMKCSTKPIWHYPHHFRHLATLPWKSTNSNFPQMWTKTQTNCTLISSNIFIHPQILILSVFKIANLSRYWLQIFCVTVVLLIYFCDQFVASEIRHMQQTSLQCLRRRQDFDKKFAFDGEKYRKKEKRNHRAKYNWLPYYIGRP